MKRILPLLKKLLPGVRQLFVVAGFIIAAIVFYNLGAGSHGGTAESPSARVESKPPNAASIHPIDTNDDGTIYTCSMHPQIKQDEPGDCPICGMELVPVDVEQPVTEEVVDHTDHDAMTESEVLGYACAMNCVPPLEEPGECPICGMEMQPVVEDRGTGPVEGDPTRRLAMSAEAKALASIQTSSVVSRIPERTIRLVGELAVSEDTLAHISADVGGRIDELTAEYEGDVVQQGEELVLLYSPELLAVQQEFLHAEAALERLPANALETVRRASARAVHAARERLRLAGLSPDQLDAIAESGEAREQVRLYAPIGGTVVVRHAQEGQYVTKGERILAIASLDTLWAEMAAYESDLPWLRVGQPVTFISEAFPGERFTGEVAWIDPVTNMRTRTTRVRLNVDNESGKLRPGMYLTARVVSTLGDEPRLVIPASAPLITGERAVVYVQVPGADRPTFQGVEVVLGSRVEDGYVVEEGLVEGQRVVTNGAFQIDSALQIIAKPSMMNPTGGIAMTGHDHDRRMALPGGPEDRPEQPVRPMDGEHGEHLADIVHAYIGVQEALAADSQEVAQEAFHNLAGQAEAAELAEVVGPAKDGASAETLEAQRRSFEQLSAVIIPIVREHGNPTEHPVRLVHCPMAFDFAGADWLQTTKEVRNPYFGAEMLTCGTVKQEWRTHD
ncbi:efflux RND transporter periplasmic adaptor subunit [bacterium]|nr:efflux RND transporter periplasmic adaptor subunit [bacterium]